MGEPRGPGVGGGVEGGPWVQGHMHEFGQDAEPLLPCMENAGSLSSCLLAEAVRTHGSTQLLGVNSLNPHNTGCSHEPISQMSTLRGSRG